MRRTDCLLAILGFVLVAAAPLTAQVGRAEIEAAIDRGVRILIEKQGEDGNWPSARYSRAYDVGHTALAVLALQHSRSKLPEAHLATKKGISYILQHHPEPRTYSAGCVLQALHWDSPTRHRKMVTAYAWMLCNGQKRAGAQKGSWTYMLPKRPANWGQRRLRTPGTPSASLSDNSNSQFGILGLVYAQKTGFQIPKVVWRRARDYYIASQHQDGGWDYRSDTFRNARTNAKVKRRSRPATMNMTLAGTVSIHLCEEMLASKFHRQCKAAPVNECHEAGLKWIADHWSKNTNAYGWYACERLGILTGYSEFGGHDWFQEGAENLVPRMGSLKSWHGEVPNTAFAVLFLARGLNPIIINKLKHRGDWNNHRYDIKHLIEHISGPWQTPCQWRIVTLDASVDFLLKVPILWISGHQALNFNTEEKAKLKEYVARGGTILGEACCSKKEFDTSFRELLKELWPDCQLTDLLETHSIYIDFRNLKHKPKLMGMALEQGQGGLGVIYIPHGMSCRWEVGGTRAKSWLDVGACIYLYIDKAGRATMRDEKQKTDTHE